MISKEQIEDLIIKFYDAEFNVILGHAIVHMVQSLKLSHNKFGQLVCDNHLNNSGDLYGLFYTLIEYAEVENGQ